MGPSDQRDQRGATFADCAVDLRLVVTDAPVGDYPEKVRCREHADKTRGNLAVYRTHLHCYACGWREPRTLYSLAYLLGVEFSEAARLAPRYTNAAVDGYRERVAQQVSAEPLPPMLADLYHQVLTTPLRRGARRVWLTDRGLSEATITRFKLGHDGNRFVIPIFDAQGRLLSLRYRRDDAYCEPSSAKYLGMKGRNGQYLYPAHLPLDGVTTLVLCEGELDALRLWQEGIPALTITNGAGQLHKLPALVRQHAPTVRTLLVAADQDEPGRAAADLTAAAATALGYMVRPLRWSGPSKDITEAFLSGDLNAASILQTGAAL